MTTPPEGCPPAEDADRPPSTPRRRHRRVTRPATNDRADHAEGQTTDDTSQAWGERDDRTGRDEWLHEQRPPHWG